MSAAILSVCALNAIGYAVSISLGTDKAYDITGSLAYLSVPFYLPISLESSSRLLLLIFLQRLWALRLGAFLFSRVLSGPEKRLLPYLRDPFGLALLFFAQTLWVLLGAAPLLVLCWESSHNSSVSLSMASPLSFVDSALLCFWLLGFLFQALADEQKRSHNSASKTFVCTGLWSMCRHPNYVGQIIQSWSLMLLAQVPLLRSSSPFVSGFLFLAPLPETLLLVLVMAPGLERTGEAKWGGSVEWRRYLKTTPKFFPKLSL